MEDLVTGTHASPGIWSVFRGRSLHLGSMGRRLRLVTALAVAQVTVAAILLALRNVHVATTPLTAGDNGLTSVPVPVLWMTVAFMALAWAYLLAGAMHAHPAAGVLGLAAFGLALIPLGQAVGWHGAPALVRAGALLGIAVVAAASWVRRPPGELDSRTVGVVRLALLIVLVGGVYASFAWDASAHTIFRFFTIGVAQQLISISFFLLPVLFVTGAEFSEWAEVAGGRLSLVADRVGSIRLLALLAGAVSVAVLADTISTYSDQLPSQVLLFGLAAGMIGWVARRARPAAGWPHGVPWAAMALVACAFIGILLIVVYRNTSLPREATTASDHTVGGQLRLYEQTDDPRFHMRVPRNWEVLTLEPGSPGSQRTLIAFTGLGTGNPSQFYVSAVPAKLLNPGHYVLPIYLAHYYPKEPTHLSPAVDDRGWRRTPFTLSKRLVGVAWERRIGGLEWLLVGFANRSVIALNRPLFVLMQRSFGASAGGVVSPAATHETVPSRADPYRYDPVLAVPFLAWLLVSVTVGLALRSRLGSRGPPGVMLGAVFVFAFSVLFVLSGLRQVLEELVDGRLGLLYSVRVPGIQAAVAVATLVVLCTLAARRQLTRERAGLVGTLLMLGVGLQLLVWISDLYNTASSVGARLSIAQAVVILLALLWELTVSGESVTNGHSRVLPRATRVLVFCGYIMLVATAVLFFSSLRMQGTGLPVQPQFESEGWPALGVTQLGVPALLCLAALRLGVFGRSVDTRAGGRATAQSRLSHSRDP